MSVFQKDPAETLDYQIDWSDFLGVLTISTSTWVVASGITKVTDSHTTTASTIRLSAGTDGVDYECANQITLSNGEIAERSIIIQVREVEIPTSVLVATVGGTTSNSYVTRAQAEAYFASRLYSSNWTDATIADKDKSLIMATARLEQESFAGYRTSLTQALKFPRTGIYVDGAYLDSDAIPSKLIAATCEYALEFLGSDVSAQSDLVNYKRVKVGIIEIEMNQPVSSGVFPSEVARLLRDLRTSGSGAQIVRA